MHKFVLLFVGVAALLSGWAIAEAQVRTVGMSQLFASDPYLPVIRTTSLGLWLIAAMAVATREVRRSMTTKMAEQTTQIIEANRKIVDANHKLVKIVTECTDALLNDVDQRKREEINSMLEEYGIETGSEGGNVTPARTHVCDPQNLLSFRRHRTQGDS